MSKTLILALALGAASVAAPAALHAAPAAQPLMCAEVQNPPPIVPCIPALAAQRVPGWVNGVARTGIREVGWTGGNGASRTGLAAQRVPGWTNGASRTGIREVGFGGTNGPARTGLAADPFAAAERPLP